ncbi:molybdopterin-binding/glycosyltransferase family 2 protein [Chelatococcus sambhunathii]|uniref:Molybdopterin-binding/glycosyltransferase family 2 protein n=1 Tax=Chelatococcus sambhunathii TaxID=363953 RepID=A0ABU1DL16_9HYPH|nr:molybdopterin-binding/glycosyltransferase family 2 protein [Chelatococcus sambhunathii]MDR4308805.1 molybdopterin-binding/glycosyltransferase family 2 protein [Chelatococcus sambhunathii]
MRFGPLALSDAVGAISAHAIKVDGYVLKKGARVTGADVAALSRRGVVEIVAAELGPDDVPEDKAAHRIALALAGAHLRCDAPFTGRSNLFAEKAGVVMVERDGVDALNALDEAITFATLDEHAVVAEGAMAATVKIIPFAMPEALVARAERLARELGPLVSVAPFELKKIAAVSTLLPGLDLKVVDKTISTLERRLAPASAKLVAERRVAHDEPSLTRALRELRSSGAELIIIFGASAVTDRRDVIPAAIEAAGGVVDRLGMPVDPGNLLLLGALDGKPVLGAPGCARSPKENGFDWVLNRLLARAPVGAREIAKMGVGGLLMETVSRPQPREGKREGPKAAKIAALVLAAGRSTRMGGPNKLLEPLLGKPLVRHAVEAAAGAGLAEVVVVTGHQAGAVERALEGSAIRFAHNPDYADGLSTSLRAGLAALASDVDAVVVMLGDMPGVTAPLVRRIASAYAPGAGVHIVAPTRNGRRGNPVLWGRRLFAELAGVDGDVGGRHLLGQHADLVAEVEAEDDGPMIDVDTPEMLAALKSLA